MKEKETKPYLADCKKCGYVTSWLYASEHKGKCRPCTTGEQRKSKDQRKASSY